MNVRIHKWLKQSRIETPVLVIDLEVIRQNYKDLQKAFPSADIHYAVKANSKFDILQRLAKEGCGFYICSPTELDNVMQTGVDPSKIAYLHVVKKPNDIAYAWQRGVRSFGFDSLEELEKIAQYAPYSHVFCRLNLAPNAPNGCPMERAEFLVRKALSLELIPMGFSFHLGAMQTTPAAYLKAIETIAPLYHRLKAQGIGLQKINMGGGLPVDYRQNKVNISDYGQQISQKISRLLGDTQLTIEAGRVVTATAGIMAAEVIAVQQTSKQVFLDVGYYNGLREVAMPSINYAIESDDSNAMMQAYNVFGPSGDGQDKLGENILLPSHIKAGDKIYIHTAGAYSSFTKGYSMHGFTFPRVACLPVAEDMPLFARKVVHLSDARLGLKKTLWG